MVTVDDNIVILYNMLLSSGGNDNNNNDERTLILWRYSVVSATAKTIVRNYYASRQLQDIIIKAIVTLRPFPAATVNNGFPLMCFLTSLALRAAM